MSMPCDLKKLEDHYNIMLCVGERTTRNKRMCSLVQPWDFFCTGQQKADRLRLYCRAFLHYDVLGVKSMDASES